MLAASRAFIVEPGTAFEPELALLETVAHTHYLPRHWRGRAHTREVQTQFQQLFQFKVRCPQRYKVASEGPCFSRKGSSFVEADDASSRKAAVFQDPSLVDRRMAFSRHIGACDSQPSFFLLTRAAILVAGGQRPVASCVSYAASTVHTRIIRNLNQYIELQTERGLSNILAKLAA